MSSDDVVCILEDDIKIDDAFAERLQEVESIIDKAKPQVVMLSSHNCKREGRGIIRSKTAVCTDAYVITQLAAKALLGANLPMQVPCDHWWRWERKGLIELYHALPTAVSQNQEMFGTSTQANAVRVSDFPLHKWVYHKVKRLIGKTIDKILG
jgi:GR25 family glycosyltransferase involved in LPS biosynthesis